MATMSRPMTEKSDPLVLQSSAAAALLSDAPWRRFAVFGDSLSLGTGDPAPGYANLGWSARVEHVLRLVNPELAYINTARIGATTAQALEEQSRRISEFEPDLLHVSSGGNDIMRRNPDWDRIEKGQRDVYAWAAGTGAQLTTFTLGRAFTLPAFPDWTDRVARLNDITRTLADEFDAVVADAWEHPLNERADLLSEDRIHFTTMGHAIVATMMVKELANRLEQA